MRQIALEMKETHKLLRIIIIVFMIVLMLYCASVSLLSLCYSIMYPLNPGYFGEQYAVETHVKLGAASFISGIVAITLFMLIRVLSRKKQDLPHNKV